MDCILHEITKQSVVRCDSDTVISIVDGVLDKDDAYAEAVISGLRDGLVECAEMFDAGRISLTDMSRASSVANEGMNAMRPFSSRIRHPKIIICTIQGDRHTAGKDIIRMELCGLGFDVIDLGADVPVDTIVEECIKNEAEAVVTSVLFVHAKENQRILEQRLREAGIRDGLVTCIGGPPTSQAWADLIGADIWSRNSSGCMKKMLEAFPQIFEDDRKE